MPAVKHEFAQAIQGVIRSPQPDGTIHLLDAPQGLVTRAMSEPEELLTQRDRLPRLQSGDDVLHVLDLRAFA